jgi:hypothetical protein
MFDYKTLQYFYLVTQHHSATMYNIEHGRWSLLLLSWNFIRLAFECILFITRGSINKAS